MSDLSTIGVFDSGLGGLTVAKKIIQKLPNENIVYFGDEAHIPYGERPAEEIESFALGICEFLISRGAKLIVMACNMSSAVALGPARRLFPEVPIIGTIEAGARAALRIANGCIGVLATTGTVKTRAYTEAIESLAPSVTVHEQACPRFVPLVESGCWETPDADAAVREYVSPLVAAGCDTLILGCTHYPYLANAIRRAAGPTVAVIDPAEETANQASNILFEAGITIPANVEPSYEFYTSAQPDRFAELGGIFLDAKIEKIGQITWGMELREIIWQEQMAEQTIRSVQ
ncbi:MAG: glutamate racemase [Armatimonadota bacterium]